ncbi:MAG: hypothetical protein IKE05_02650 [Clostridia bacterium]|nr:hypothetical protein [Clostridia bacterium]
MSKEKIMVQLSDEELAEVCGGDNSEDFKKGFYSEAGKQTLLFIAAPIVVGVSTAIAGLAHWGIGRLTKKLDKKIDGEKVQKPLQLNA